MSDDGAMNMKAYLRGISPNIGLKLWDPKDEGTQLDISLEDFNNDIPAMDRILVDINNFENMMMSNAYNEPQGYPFFLNMDSFIYYIMLCEGL